MFGCYNLQIHSVSSRLVAWQLSTKSTGLTKSVRASRLWKCSDLNFLPQSHIRCIGQGWLKWLESFEGNLVKTAICSQAPIITTFFTPVLYRTSEKLSKNNPSYILSDFVVPILEELHILSLLIAHSDTWVWSRIVLKNLFATNHPRGGTPRKVPHHDHSLNWKKTPFAYQTQTVADPFHIQSILPQQPLLHRQNI